MTTKQALKCIKEDFKVVESSWQDQAVSRIEDVINRIAKIVSKYDVSKFDEDEVKDLSFNDIIDLLQEVFDDMAAIKLFII